MKANTRGQFKAAAYPRTVTGACGPVLKKREPMEAFPGSPPGKSWSLITLLNHLFNSLFISLSAPLNEEEVKPVLMLCWIRSWETSSTGSYLTYSCHCQKGITYSVVGFVWLVLICSHVLHWTLCLKDTGVWEVR